MADGNGFPTYDVFDFSLQTLVLQTEPWGNREMVKPKFYSPVVEELKVFKKTRCESGLNTQLSENSEETSFDLAQRLHKMKLF